MKLVFRQRKRTQGRDCVCMCVVNVRVHVCMCLYLETKPVETLYYDPSFIKQIKYKKSFLYFFLSRCSRVEAATRSHSPRHEVRYK